MSREECGSHGYIRKEFKTQEGGTWKTMSRKQNSLVPIGKIIGGLSGPVQAIRDDSPQARRGFTVADQVNQLVSASEAEPDRGFMARTMALCSLPRCNPGNRIRYVRRNGPFTLVMTTTGLHKLPHGSNPRLMLAWISTEAVRTGSREIVLGRSLSEFMRKLGISSTDGRGQARLRNQMKRLFNCSVQLNYTAAGRETSATALVAELTDFWWNPKHPDQTGLWESKVRLSEAFFNEIVSHPVPLDLTTLKALKRSPLGLDLYLWLVYRIFALTSSQRLTWRQLYWQFGVDPDKASDRVTVRNFQRQAVRELKKIKLAWPELNYSTAPGVLILHPSTPAIAPRNQGQLTS